MRRSARCRLCVKIKPRGVFCFACLQSSFTAVTQPLQFAARAEQHVVGPRSEILMGTFSPAATVFRLGFKFKLHTLVYAVSAPPLQADITCPGFQEYHERLQTFLMWFIETASFIDADDDRWDFFLMLVPHLFDITPPPLLLPPTLKPLLCH